MGKWDDRIKEIDNSQMELNKRKNECYLRLIEILNNQKQIEATQIQLSECDKFAEAEQLDEKLQSLQDEIRSIYQEIGKISKNWIVLEDEKCAVYGKLTTLRKEGIKKLKNLEEEQEEVVEEITRKIKQEREEMEFNIGSKIQRIDRDLEHIKVDLSNLTDKQQKIMVMVKERTASQCTEKEIYSEKLGKLKEEIASLLARLDMLRREESHCQEKLDSIDTEINTASQRYQSELKAIEQDRQKTLQEQSQLNLKKTDIQREKAKYDRALQSLQTTGNNEKQVLVSISKSIGGSREMIETFDSLLIASQRAKIKAEHLFEQEIEETTELKLLRVKQLDYTEQIRNYSASILKLHSEINNFEQAIKLNQETSLPNLEAEKKLTVSNRDFKGAQIIHKQIVTLKEQVEEMSTKKKQSEMVLSTTVENRKKCQTAYEDIKKHIEIKEKEQDMKNLALITERIRELENGKQAAKSKAEINKIESELEITINKSKYIQFKHNLEKNPYANPNNATEVTVAVPTEIPTAEKFEPVQTEIPNTENLTPEQIETKISALKEDIIQLESQIEVAISQDDFVKADELQQQINDKTKVIAALQSK
uniref:UVR domain-containing protein n=1 Tax=Arcella intermedia TaxID=1963864 RepID=A0A6B2L078_9EUKA